MSFNWPFRKKLSIKEGEELLAQYCEENGFDNVAAQWKSPTHATHWFAYSKQSDKVISKNWVAFHPIRGNTKYSVWIDLVTEEIREVCR